MVVFSLIVAKWIAPKGKLTDNQLSQLLLIYIASGADIIELLEIFTDEKVSDFIFLVFVLSYLKAVQMVKLKIKI